MFPSILCFPAFCHSAIPASHQILMLIAIPYGSINPIGSTCIPVGPQNHQTLTYVWRKVWP